VQIRTFLQLLDHLLAGADFADYPDDGTLLLRTERKEIMMDMTRVTASEFQKAFGAMSDKALREPVAITKQGRDHLVVISAEEYARLKRRDRTVHAAGELPDEWLEAVRNAKMPAGLEHLDAELK
jgi:prevent-host-death family protein